jgi:glycosyltransferase involved in cell wall biosynthesis
MIKMNDPLDISILIPLYNEEESLKELCEKITAVIKKLDKSYEIIFVDDGSTDNSFNILQELHEECRHVKVFQFRRNYGKSAALAYGFGKAQGNFIITMDADLQDDPNEIPALIDKLNDGFDLVSGWKNKRHDPFIKKYTSRIYNKVTSMVSGLKIHDFNCGLKAYRKEVVQSLQIYGQMHRYIPMLAHRQGFRVVELEVRHHARKYGKTKFGTSRFTAGFFDLLTLSFLDRFNKRPLHLFGSLGLISFLAGAAILIYLAYFWFFIDSSLSNRPIMFLGILLNIVGVQFISIGLLGEMITENNKKEVEYSIKNSLE